MATLYVEYKDNGKKDENGKTILEKSEEVIKRCYYSRSLQF